MTNSCKPLSKAGRVLFIATFLFFLLNVKTSAQRFGLGIQLGSPTGISTKFHDPESLSLDLLIAWDLKRFFFFNVHGTWERPVLDSPFGIFFGPGGFLGVERQRDTVNRGNVLVTGVSATIGFNIFFEEIEFSGRATPRYSLTNIKEFSVGGGLGFRYYF